MTTGPKPNRAGQGRASRDERYTGKDSYFFTSTNLPWRACKPTFRQPAGLDVMLRLADQADVVIDHFCPRVMEAMGLGYETVAAQPAYHRILDFRRRRQRSNARYVGVRPGRAGLLGLESGTITEGSGPMRVWVAIGDLLGGIFAAQESLLALQARHRSRRSQRLETSLMEAIVSVLSWSAGIYFDTGHTPGPARSHHPLAAPHGVREASEPLFNIASGNETMRHAPAETIGRPELKDGPRFSSPAIG
jgi:crotonobetainyl-CoA:carnitine CoA-transferase CaiB-like acyl-CoA transferase